MFKMLSNIVMKNLLFAAWKDSLRHRIGQCEYIMNESNGHSGFAMPLLPLLVDAKTASKLCGVGLSLWYELSAAGRTPKPVKLHSKSLWAYDLLKVWAEHDCPNRESAEWQNVLAEIRGRKEAK
jgi:hypothetical protein